MLHVGNLQGQFLKAMDQYLFLLWFSNLPKYLQVGFTPFFWKLRWCEGGSPKSLLGDACPFSCREIRVCVVSSFLLLSWVLCCPPTSLPTGSWKWLKNSQRYHSNGDTVRWNLTFTCVWLAGVCVSVQWEGKRTWSLECICEATQNECPSHRAPAPLPSSRSDFLSADLQQKGQKLQGTLLCYFCILFMPRSTEWTVRKNSAKLWKGVRHNFTRRFPTLCSCFLALCKLKLSP